MKKTVAGVVILIWLFSGCVTIKRLFAPKFVADGVHTNASKMTESQCLACHREGKEEAPVAPKSMLKRKNCIRCHLKK